MEQLHLKSAEELKAFFTAFVARIDSIPESCCSYKLLPCLTQVRRPLASALRECCSCSRPILSARTRYVSHGLLCPSMHRRLSKTMSAGASTSRS